MTDDPNSNDEALQLDIPSLYRMPIDQLLLDDNDLPFFIPVVCEFLRKFSHVCGLFRICGSHSMVQNLGVIFDLQDCAVPPNASVHDVTSFLKQWLTQLPEPLIPPNLINDIYNPNDPDSVVTILNNMPVTNRKCVASIFSVIKAILDNKEINKMDQANLSTCFVNAFTQNMLGLSKPMPFNEFFEKAVAITNEEMNDFIL
ncbi:RhoGAP domain containing protein [Tritrichomonas foetus]|uniref:RhoGAP domain containing protein n=1 Tax=Tritrichomonas foetus TaxID=1144522 RepID=A0A1J4JIQ4_9EUKA|nr:RhoGAP domain containing protein [Tritrichomonas foetus]|eukprot:OHS97435.1 RhoGAP domain containing protein [Tritrichomonas foetus]